MGLREAGELGAAHAGCGSGRAGHGAGAVARPRGGPRRRPRRGRRVVKAWERCRLDAQELSLVHLPDEAVVPAAEGLLAQAPHRERAWSALAAALYGLGRQGEALATIRRARRTFAEDLGIDLSPELEGLERDLLQHRLTPGEPPPLPNPAPGSWAGSRDTSRSWAGSAAAGW